MKAVFGIVALLIFCACFSNAVRAQEEDVKYVDVIERGHFFKSKHFAPTYEKRVNAIREQIDLGVSKGWISSDRSEQLKGEASRIMVTVDALGKKDPTQAEADDLDRNITRLNTDVHQAMQGASPPPAPAEPASPVPASATSAAPSASGATAGAMKAAPLKPLSAKPVKATSKKH